VTAIFVFGSNLAGRHGKGAALWAREHRGAIYGQGEGLQGDSYAIPTKDGRNGASLSGPQARLSLIEINRAVVRFLIFADDHPELDFEVTTIGCGLAGYLPREIAPMFRIAGPNVRLPDAFKAVLNRDTPLTA
jgi:hypothetical protein